MPKMLNKQCTLNVMVIMAFKQTNVFLFLPNNSTYYSSLCDGFKTPYYIIL